MVQMEETHKAVTRMLQTENARKGKTHSVVEDAQVAGHNLVLEHRAGRNVNAITMVGNNNDGTLSRKIQTKNQHPR